MRMWQGIACLWRWRSKLCVSASLLPKSSLGVRPWYVLSKCPFPWHGEVRREGLLPRAAQTWAENCLKCWAGFKLCPCWWKFNLLGQVKLSLDQAPWDVLELSLLIAEKSTIVFSKQCPCPKALLPPFQELWEFQTPASCSKGWSV